MKNRKNQEDTSMEYIEMKDRIAHIIRAKNLTAAEFAMQLGIQPSNVSHLLAGRNNPSLDFVKKLKETFPEYSLDWIVMGKGSMTVSEPFFEPQPSPESPQSSVQPAIDAEPSFEKSLFASEIVPESPQNIDKKTIIGELKHIIMVYSDNSFEVLSPK